MTNWSNIFSGAEPKREICHFELIYIVEGERCENLCCVPGISQRFYAFLTSLYKIKYFSWREFMRARVKCMFVRSFQCIAVSGSILKTLEVHLCMYTSLLIVYMYYINVYLHCIHTVATVCLNVYRKVKQMWFKYCVYAHYTETYIYTV